jgi:hypothetical protein
MKVGFRIPSLKKRIAVRTAEGRAYTYGHLIVCPGIQLNIDDIPGLREALATDKVCSNYIDPEKTKRVMTAFKGRHGGVHAAQHAHQVRGRAPEGGLPGR